MPPTIFLSTDDSDTTLCTKCKNYLSVAPVIIHSNNIVCGRCVKEHKLPEDNRALFYESLAKYMFFPCKNNGYGCSVKIPWGKVLNHEVSCMYERMICPAVNCETKVVSDEIAKHFQTSHQDLIQNDNRYHFSQSKDHFINKLYIRKKQLFIIQTRNDNGDIFFRISSIKGDIREILLCIKGKSSSSSICLNKFAVMKYDSKLPIFSDEEKININTLKNILGIDIICEFTFGDGAASIENTNESKLFSEMECPICISYMRPPIYMCSAGHSLCGQCKSKLQRCPSCQSAFSISRNYSLEKIAQIVKYPCRNKDQGCDVVANIDNITRHESNCSASYHNSEVNCFTNSGCCWRGIYAKVFEHISSSHPNLCVGLGSLLILHLYSRNNVPMFLLYDKRIFVLHVKYACNEHYVGFNTCEDIDWAVSCISKEKVIDQYVFFLEIIKEKRILNINGNCEKRDPTNLYPSYFITTSKSLIKDFEEKNTLTFKLNISNQN